MTVTRLLDWSMAGLWALVFIGLFVLTSWQLQANWINQVDGLFRDRYLYQPEIRFERLLADYEQTGNDEAAVHDLKGLLQDLHAVQKGDAVAHIKRVAFAQLVLVLRRQQRITDALTWTGRWLTFDSRDLDGLLNRALLLMTEPDTRAEAQFQLALLKDRFPHSLAVANGTATAYASIGQLGRAFIAFVPFVAANDNPLIDSIGDTIIRKWRLITEPLAKEWRQEGSRVVISYEPGEKIDELTVLFFSGLELTINVASSRLKLPFITRGLTETGDGVYRKRTGSSASISLQDIVVSEPVTISVETTLAMPESLEKLLTPRMRPIVVSQLREDNRHQALQAYLRLYDAHH